MQARTQRRPDTNQRLGDENTKEWKPRNIVSHRKQRRRIGIERDVENVGESRLEVDRDVAEIRKPESGRFMKKELVGIGNSGTMNKLNLPGPSDVDIF